MEVFYVLNLFVFAMCNVSLGTFYLFFQKDRLSCRNGASLRSPSSHAPQGLQNAEARKFLVRFFAVYILVMAADWLQGPHLYALYKYDKNIDEETVAMLYATGFLSAAASAIWAGQLADRVGRTFACTLYPVFNSFANLSLHVDYQPVLILGRASGGIATTLLFSAFETWMIADYHAVALDDVLPLSMVLGNMTFLSTIVGILSGVVGDALVEATHLRTVPFAASTLCSGVASLLIYNLWVERKSGNTSPSVDARAQLYRSALKIIRNKRLLALGVASSCFEGSMYLFIFFWSAALKSARRPWNPDKELPYGFIFSSFMCAMMTGSLIFSLLFKGSSKKEASMGLAVTMLVASLSLLGAAYFQSEPLIFWAFSLFEVCVGVFLPMLGLLKSQSVVDDDIRGTIYSLFRLPMNLLVLIAHCLDKEGDEHRKNVFKTLACLLILAATIMARNSASMES